jgi:hypothetical protein
MPERLLLKHAPKRIPERKPKAHVYGLADIEHGSPDRVLGEHLRRQPDPRLADVMVLVGDERHLPLPKRLARRVD